LARIEMARHAAVALVGEDRDRVLPVGLVLRFVLQHGAIESLGAGHVRHRYLEPVGRVFRKKAHGSLSPLSCGGRPPGPWWRNHHGIPLLTPSCQEGAPAAWSGRRSARASPRAA